MTSNARICVFCGSRIGRDPRCAEAARALGEAIARLDCDLVFGGGNGGLMGIVSQTALSGGARVTGIIPNFLFEREPPADNLTELITVEDFSSRKRLMMERAGARRRVRRAPGRHRHARRSLRSAHEPLDRAPAETDRFSRSRRLLSAAPCVSEKERRGGLCRSVALFPRRPRAAPRRTPLGPSCAALAPSPREDAVVRRTGEKNKAGSGTARFRLCRFWGSGFAALRDETPEAERKREGSRGVVIRPRAPSLRRRIRP